MAALSPSHLAFPVPSLSGHNATSAAVTRFLLEPCVRFGGEVGEQAVRFFPDPGGNVLEFKAFADHSRLFASAELGTW